HLYGLFPLSVLQGWFCSSGSIGRVFNSEFCQQTTQSSVYPAGIPMNAIDGNRASNWNQSSCSHTQDNFSPWWRVDLLKTYKVVSVSITNRDILPERINGAEIRIGNSLDNNGNNNPRDGTVPEVPLGESFTLDFTSKVEGCYVTVKMEVEVYGYPAANGESLSCDMF
uniref:Fucolectin tachylectin-4 pentraxin-1 domain-containing protein n=1 Tax=Myripristis murdjan TaxID=586833 RepID=A0A667XK23_9TELE